MHACVRPCWSVWLFEEYNRVQSYSTVDSTDDDTYSNEMIDKDIYFTNTECLDTNDPNTITLWENYSVSVTDDVWAKKGLTEQFFGPLGEEQKPPLPLAILARFSVFCDVVMLDCSRNSDYKHFNIRAEEEWVLVFLIMSYLSSFLFHMYKWDGKNVNNTLITLCTYSKYLVSRQDAAQAASFH